MTITADNKNVFRHTFVLLLSIAVGLVCYVILSQISGHLTIHDFESNPIGQLQTLLLKSWVPWAILSPLVVFIARRFPISPNNWLSLIFIHLIFLLLVSLIHGAMISYHYHFLEDMNDYMATFLPWQHIGHFLFGDSLFLFDVIIYTAFIASFNLRNFYNIAEQRVLEAENLAYKLTESKLHALRMQINPHFLFNTLNVISVLVMKKENDKASDMIEKLSVFFRQTLDESSEQLVPLKKELDMISQYLSIEQLRFGDRLIVEERYNNDVMLVPVPSMILQPLVENAVGHGLGEKEEAGKLIIECKRLTDKLLIQIIDDGVGCTFEQDPNFKAGVGLTNVKQRLQQMYPGRHVFKLQGAAGKGVTISIEIPIDTNNDAIKSS
jgi:two-component system, LytTR family, sensor kinase